MSIDKRDKRKTRIRSKIKKSLKPRLSVFRSNKFIYAQIIDDQTGKSLFGISEKNLPKDLASKNNMEKAHEIGLLMAKKAIEQKIKSVVFDRGSYSYHGKVKALAEGAREGGLKL